MKIVTLVAVIAAALFACHDRGQTPSASGDTRQRTESRSAPGTQVDLTREIDAAERTGSFEAVRARWRGRRVMWTVTRHRVLCSSASSCHVAAFPVQRPASHGWMPGLEMSDRELSDLDARCHGAERCELEIEATLSELTVSPEQPVSMVLGDVVVLRATPG
jgi:hypothetical protein